MVVLIYGTFIGASGRGLSCEQISLARDQKRRVLSSCLRVCHLLSFVDTLFPAQAFGFIRVGNFPSIWLYTRW